MKEYLDKIDAFLNSIVKHDIWKQVKNFINKIRGILENKGDDDAVEFIDVMVN